MNFFSWINIFVLFICCKFVWVDFLILFSKHFEYILYNVYLCYFNYFIIYKMNFFKIFLNNYRRIYGRKFLLVNPSVIKKIYRRVCSASKSVGNIITDGICVLRRRKNSVSKTVKSCSERIWYINSSWSVSI